MRPPPSTRTCAPVRSAARRSIRSRACARSSRLCQWSLPPTPASSHCSRMLISTLAARRPRSRLPGAGGSSRSRLPLRCSSSESSSRFAPREKSPQSADGHRRRRRERDAQGRVAAKSSAPPVAAAPAADIDLAPTETKGQEPQVWDERTGKARARRLRTREEYAEQDRGSFARRARSRSSSASTSRLRRTTRRLPRSQPSSTRSQQARRRQVGLSWPGLVNRKASARPLRRRQRRRRLRRAAASFRTSRTAAVATWEISPRTRRRSRSAKRRRTSMISSTMAPR
jgi:hypothetical protein